MCHLCYPAGLPHKFSSFCVSFWVGNTPDRAEPRCVQCEKTPHTQNHHDHHANVGSGNKKKEEGGKRNTHRANCEIFEHSAISLVVKRYLCCFVSQNHHASLSRPRVKMPGRRRSEQNVQEIRTKRSDMNKKKKKRKPRGKKKEDDG